MKYRKVNELEPLSCNGCVFKGFPSGCLLPFDKICDPMGEYIFVKLEDEK